MIVKCYRETNDGNELTRDLKHWRGCGLNLERTKWKQYILYMHQVYGGGYYWLRNYKEHMLHFSIRPPLHSLLMVGKPSPSTWCRSCHSCCWTICHVCRRGRHCVLTVSGPKTSNSRSNRKPIFYTHLIAQNRAPLFARIELGYKSSPARLIENIMSE
jgi:hypothetical protein